jgi:hypothetical protein
MLRTESQVRVHACSKIPAARAESYLLCVISLAQFSKYCTHLSAPFYMGAYVQKVISNQNKCPKN